MRLNLITILVILVGSATLLLGRALAEETAAGRTVVIYAANTPHETRLREMVELLAGNNDEAIRKTVGRIENDLANFPQAASDEIAALSKAAINKDFDLVVLTNESLRAGHYIYISQGQAGTGRVEASRLGAAYTAYPLTDAAVFAGALRDIADHFSPTNHEFVLVVKSHGNDEFALVSMLSGKIDIQSAERLTNALKNAQAVASAETSMMDTLDPDNNDTLSPDENSTLDPDSNDTLGANGEGTLDPDSNDTLGANGEGTLDPDSNDTLSIDGDASDLSGLTKDQFADALAGAGQRGMRFSLVVLEACHSEFDANQLQVMAPAVKTLVTTTDSTGYRNADYSHLGSNVVADLKAAFAEISPFAVQELR
jgi:hypothetical protein